MPISASKLAQHFSVSRQIIVGDIALLRASGYAVTATPRGYLSDTANEVSYTVPCCHTPEQMERELQIFVDNGCVVQDVIVEHPVYGEIRGQLMLKSRFDISRFIEKCHSSDASPLSALTGGIHLHTVTAGSPDCVERAKLALKSAGFLVE